MLHVCSRFSNNNNKKRGKEGHERPQKRAAPKEGLTSAGGSRHELRMTPFGCLAWLLVASSSNLAAAMSIRWDGPLSRSRRAVSWGGLAAAACCSLLPARPALAQNLIPPGPYKDYYGVLPAWPGGGPAVPDSEKSDFLVEELERKYLLSPADLSGVVLPAALRGQRDVVLIFHGRGGEDRETDDLRAAVLAADAAAGVSRAVLCFNWERWIESDQHGQSALLGSAPIRSLCLLRARLAAPCSSALLE